MNLKETILYYLECGINCMPIWLGTNEKGQRKEVVPSWKTLQTRRLKPDEVDAKLTAVRKQGVEPNAVAIITGPTSGHLTCLDIDTKNAEIDGHDQENAINSLFYFCEEYFNTLVLEKTWSGGLHVFYRKAGPSKVNILELARSVSGKELIAEMNDTKIIYVDPSPNYQIIQGGWDEIATLTDDQLGSIYAFATSWDEYGRPAVTVKTPAAKPGGSTGTWEITPWDDFKAKRDALSLALEMGWTLSREESNRTILTRPGSDVTNAKSAIYEHDKGILWILTSSVPELIQHGQYDAYSFWTYMVHGGDFTKACKEAARLGYGKSAPDAKPFPEDEDPGDDGAKRGRPKLDVWDCIRNYLVDIQGLMRNDMTGELEQKGEPIPDTSINQFYIDINKRHPKVKGLNWQNYDKVLKSDMIPAYHPLEDYFKSLNDIPTTGNLINELLDCIEPMSDFIRLCMRRWLIGIPGNVFKKEDIPNILMPVLYGQVSHGKTEFIRRLLPADLKKYYTEDEFNPDQLKDSQEKMVKNLLVAFDEFHLSKKVDARSFRQFISASMYDYREPYGRKNVKKPRMGSLAGTANHDDFIDEAVYNRRIIPIRIEKIHHEKYNAIDKKLLMAECYQALLAGEPYVLSRDESIQLSVLSKENEPPSTVEELLIKWLVPAEPGDIGISKMTATDILIYLDSKARFKASPSNVALGRALSRLGFIQKWDEVNGRSARLYHVRKINEDEIDIESNRKPEQSSDLPGRNGAASEGEDLPF